MFKGLRDKITFSGMAAFSIGMALLAFTFTCAYTFLNQNQHVITSADLSQTFGQAFSLLIEASIRLAYLVVMGWAASLITVRGVSIITQSPQPPKSVPPSHSGVRHESEVHEEPVKSECEETEIESTEQTEKSAEPETQVVFPEPISQDQISNA
jgi:hypothetical protein